MPRSSISLRACALTLLSLINLASAHTVLTYPGWRGDNLHTNGTVEESNGLAVGTNNASGLYWPYGMQWSYPCGGMPTSTNRTKWPLKGGAVAFQPGWFAGHGTAYIYINMGIGTIPPNMSHNLVRNVQIIGPTAEPWPGSVCFPQVPIPLNVTFNVGDNATLQVIETAVHGAALYNCVDITFAEPEDVEPVTPQNCYNSSDVQFDLVFSTSSLSSDGSELGVSTRYNYATVALSVLLGYLMV